MTPGGVQRQRSERQILPDAGERPPTGEPRGKPENKNESALSYCPRCAAKLESRSCKLICPGCGYYMSCSDFY